MSETTIIISVLFLILILSAVSIGWFFFIYLPKATISIARELAKVIKEIFGFTPQVTINQRIVYKQTQEILELAMLQQEFEVEHHFKDIWMGSEKQILLRGTYRAKIGFDLTKGFQIEVRRGRVLKPAEIAVYLPRAEILSVEELDIQKLYSLGGYINWLTDKDIETASKQLMALDRERASKLEILADAEKRIENKLSEFFLPKPTLYPLNYEVKFIEPG